MAIGSSPLFFCTMHHDNASFVGVAGTILSLTLSQVSAIASILAAMSTFVYMAIKIHKELKGKKNAIQQSDSDKG